MGDPEYDRLDRFLNEHKEITKEHRASTKRTFKKIGDKVDKLADGQHVAAVKLGRLEERVSNIDTEKIKDDISVIVDLKLELVRVRANAEIERLNNIPKKASIDWVKIMKIVAAAMPIIAGLAAWLAI